MSAVWEYFELDAEKDATARCKSCKKDVSRGGNDSGRYNTTNLIKHLKKYHGELHEEFAKATENKKRQHGSSLTQPTLLDTFKSREKLTRESKKAKEITEHIAHFIVLDDQPLSVVNNVGFRRLINHLEPRYEMPSRSYVTETVIPNLHRDVRGFLAKYVGSAEALSFTTDIWSSDVSPMSLLSLTAHWVDADFTPRRAVLHAREFRGSHTFDTIMDALKQMLCDWQIDKKKVHVILRDNAANMKKAMDQLEVASLGCFAHTLQLIVHEGLL